MQTTTPINFDIKTTENAPLASQEILATAKKAYGFAPNLLGLMSNHPALLHAYWEGDNFLSQNSVLTPVERQVAFLSASFENNCHYCMAAHSTIGQMTKVPQDAIDALRAGTTIPDAKLEALSQYVKATTVKRGRVSQEDIQDFLKAGFTQKSILEVITIVGFKVFTNYTNYIAQTPVDAPFQANIWEPKN
ncbi:MAG: carboxymuconolactone decarboxylase family protein [Aureispira sp.]